MGGTDVGCTRASVVASRRCGLEGNWKGIEEAVNNYCGPRARWATLYVINSPPSARAPTEEVGGAGPPPPLNRERPPTYAVTATTTQMGFSHRTQAHMHPCDGGENTRTQTSKHNSQRPQCTTNRNSTRHLKPKVQAGRTRGT